MSDRPLCRHCQAKKVNRPRGLCWGCYYTPGLKDRYPVSDSPCARRGVPNYNGERPLPEPTDAPPGSEAKVAVLEERAGRSQNLWHPRDNVGERVPACLARTGRVLVRFPRIPADEYGALD